MFIVRVLVIMIRLFRCHLQHSFLLDLHSYHDYHVCITKSVSLAKRRFRRNKDIVMQCFCFCFDAIISAYTEWTFLHSLLTQHIWSRWVENTYQKMLLDLLPKILLLLRLISLHLMCWLFYVEIICMSALVMLVHCHFVSLFGRLAVIFLSLSWHWEHVCC